MSRLFICALLLALFIFSNESRATADDSLDGDLFKNFDFEANDGPASSITKGHKKVVKTSSYSKIVKKYGSSGSKDIGYAGGCTSRPDIPLNGNVSCSSNAGCFATCAPGYRFSRGERELVITCQNKRWRIQGADYYDDGVLPQCEPICLPECKNNGICASPNRCDCPENFSGPQCQFESKPCLNLPAMIANAQRKCSSKSCTITCLNHFVFPDGSSVANLVCKHGDWQPARSDWLSVPDCQPVCSPPCENSGVCLSLNVCQCPKDYRGPQCQYHVDSCSSSKLNFNGGYHCASLDPATYSCSLTCPDGAPFEFPPAASYACRYDTGVFEPQPVPRCRQPIAEAASLDKYRQISYRKTASFNGTRSTQASYGSDGYSSVTGEKVTKKAQSGVCFAWGGVHYKAFDGRIYSFESRCAYTLLTDTRDGLFTVTIQNQPTRKIHVYIQGEDYTLLSSSALGEIKLLSSNKTLPIPTQLPQLRVERAHAAKFVLVSLDALGLSIKWDGENLLQLKVEGEALWNRTAGLCGSSRWDDSLRERSVARLADRWRVEEIGGEKCDELPSTLEHACATDPQLEREASEFCTKLLHSEPRYSSCANLLDLRALESSCRWDYCSCEHGDRRKCACDTMGVYARQCAHEGLMGLSGWRDQSLCPMDCSAGKVYMSCAPTTQSSCGTIERHPSSNDVTTPNVDDDCEDGCFCPVGTLLHESRCISPDRCPCKLRGKSFEPGATVPKDCNTCACQAGKWVCSDAKCSGRCSAVGDPHYTTFDGKRYDFMGVCSYYLVKGEGYSVEADNAVCGSAISEMMGYARSYAEGEPTCTRSVTIRLNNSVSVRLEQSRRILVNGEDVSKLPVLASGIKIRVLSSIFVAVGLPNGIEVLWDGVSRVYVNAPAELRGRTKGLCGTFTSNQKRDFLTPAGDVEQSVAAFANKWKTDDKCDDARKDASHPCDADPRKRAAAERYCSALRERSFRTCHWHVDPEPYYEDCAYDMCACEASNVETCLCPTLADYAAECARLGVEVASWRQEVKECRVRCQGDQEYQVCGSSCARSCADISFHGGDCAEQCVEGCNCPRGYALDNSGECIPIGQCPCAYGEIEFLAGYKEIRAGNKGQELCSCAGGIWKCQAASSSDLLIYPSSTSQLKTKCSASRHQILATCEPSGEPATCANMHRQRPQTTPAVCRPGCTCEPGYVLVDSRSDECVEASKCPCYHGGRSYAEGSAMQEECNSCRCGSGGKWLCTDVACPGVCVTWGDSHHRTFDDRYYDFQGACDYVLAKGKLSDAESFDVTIRNVACGTTGATCSKSVKLQVGQQESVTLTRGKTLSEDAVRSLGRISLRRAGLFVFLDVPDLGLVVQWDQGTRVRVRLSPKWRTRTRGLCGDYNDDASDDFKTPSGGPAEASTALFADSWKMSEACAEPDETVDTCARHPERTLWATHKCRVIKSKVFEPCHSEVAPDEFIDRCVYDACGCDDGGDCDCLCTAVAAYAHECNARGVPIRWRSQNLCPMQCDEACSTYSACVSTCPRENCDNLATIHDTLHMCDQDICVEGCQPKACPDGQVYLNASHAECVPRDSCKTLCRVIDGVEYYEGDRVQGDECHSCYCSRGKLVCKGEPCSSSTVMPLITTTTTTVKYIELKEEKKKCISGWSGWYNRDMPKDAGFRSDIEEIPKVVEMLKDEGATAVCDKDKMIDIRCRVADTKVSYKQLGINVECSLENGLLCLPPPSEKPKSTCPDFEISVLCQCEDAALLNTTTKTIVPNACMLNEPYHAKLENCYGYVQCAPGPQGGNIWVDKTCAPDMMFNERMQICDWPANVAVVRPECAVGYNNNGAAASSHSHSEASAQLYPGGYAAICSPGEHWSDCAIQCSRTCSYYHQILVQQGLCDPTVDCLPGCVPSNRLECTGNDQLWRDQLTCVDRSNCVCITSDGQPLSPGTTVKSGACKSCQCINDYYTCVDDCGGVDESLNYTVVANVTKTHQESGLIVIPNSATPPRSCPTDNYSWLLEKHPFDAIVSASSYESSALTSDSARLRRVSTMYTWRPNINDDLQYVEINFDKSKPIYGVVIGGDAFDDRFVTSYKVLFSEDGQVFSYVGVGVEPKIFRGPIDAAVPVRQIFDTPFEARVVRVTPLSWHKGIAMQVELVGCEDVDVVVATTAAPSLIYTTPIVTEFEIKPICDEPMGYDNYAMSDQQITVSSSQSSPPNLRLSSNDIWRPQLDSPDQHAQFDFLEPRNLTGIETKGFAGIWTTAYKVYYSSGSDAKHWNPVVMNGVEKEFLANVDDVGSKVNYFERPVAARWLRIVPTKWHMHIGLKVEVHGCFLPYPILEHSNAIVPPAPASDCNVCKGITIKDTDACKCAGSLWWDGQFCVNRSECPCVVGHATYAVGASYDTPDCHQCLCTLGGNAVCHPKRCAICIVPGDRPILTELCTCLCKPCPTAQRLCPTSKVCIDEAKWCDGVQDCPDDEYGCEYTAKTEVVKENVIKVQCRTTCPPGFVMVPEVQDTGFAKAGYGSYNFSMQRTESYKSTVTIKIKVPPPAPNFQSRLGEDSDSVCPKIICKPDIVKSIGYVESDQCQRAICPDGFQPKYDGSKGLLRKATCDNTCVPVPARERVCKLVGRTFVTFDLLEYKYDVCNHVLARDRDENRWYIVAEKTCNSSDLLTCQLTLTLVIDDYTITLYPDMRVKADGLTYTSSEVKRLNIDKNPWTKLSRVGDALRVESRTYPIWAVLDSSSNVRIGASEELATRVDGMCGYLDGLAGNDQQTPEAKLARSSQEFGDSWKVLDSAECSLKTCPSETQQEAWKMCTPVRDSTFDRCKSIVDREKFISRCLESTCSCLSSGMSTSEKCRCSALTAFVAECLAAGNDSLDLRGWRTVHDCPAMCEPPFVHSDCFGNKCERSCDNLRQLDPCPAVQGLCVPGCFCPDGTVRNGDTCVQPSQCRDCACDSLSGSSRFVAFDGSNVAFDGNCSYVVSRDTKVKKDSSEKHVYEVLVSNGGCRDAICTDSIIILYDTHVIQIKKDAVNGEFAVVIDELPSTYPHKTNWLEIVVSTPNRDLDVVLPAIQLQIVAYRQNFAFVLRLPSHTFGGRMEGLCGDCNAERGDDLRKSDGEITSDANDFGRSWLVRNLPTWLNASDAHCTPQKPAKHKQQQQKDKKTCKDNHECHRLLKDESFARCHALVDPTPYHAACLESTCESGRYCGNLEAYARMCSIAGVCLDWRRSNLCAYDCPSHLEYRPCESGCPLTCETLNDAPACTANPIEGCFCPGPHTTILHANDSCISERDCRVCDDQGHVQGDVWQTDKCTTCSCDKTNKVVKCERLECPEVVCDERSSRIVVKGTEQECCAKYLCVPSPTEATAATCVQEMQQPECGYAQILKTSVDTNGCQKFICQCVPEDQCASYESAYETLPLEPGYVEVTNTSGCCPRTAKVCKPETCPAAALECERYHERVMVKASGDGSCCPVYECEAPRDACIYRPTESDSIVSKRIGDSWNDGECKSCSCESAPTARCTTKSCYTTLDHPDARDYQLEEVRLDGQCCPGYRRVGCRYGDKVYKVGEKWYPNASDSCTTMLCAAMDIDGAVSKRSAVQDCAAVRCEIGYEYRESKDAAVECCGECVAVACVVDGLIKSVGEVWYAADFCERSECVKDNGTLHVRVTKETCDATSLDSTGYKIERQAIPGQCCPRVVKTACLGDDDGKYHEPGERWQSTKDSCVVESCSFEATAGEIEKKRDVKICSRECPKGWEYRNPDAAETCCGECKQINCVDDEREYTPGSVWYSSDNCTTYACTRKNDQLVVSKSSQVCPSELNCAPELVYHDGCCKRCNVTRLSSVKEQACVAEVFDFDETIGILEEKTEKHGLCKNLQPIEGLTECHGQCNSSTHFDKKTWDQVIDCNCCQPVDFRKINVELTCEDGKKLKKILTVPAICSCETCSSDKEELPAIIKPYDGVKSYLKEHQG